MVNKEIILKRIIKIEDKLFVSKILDKAVKAEISSNPICSDFIDPYQRSLLEKAFSGEMDLDYTFEGGFAGAERVLVVFRPSFMYEDDELELPLKLIEIKLKARESLNHRDYLGSLMGLGIKREKIGDILVREDSSSIVVIKDIADYISYNLVKVGNSGVSIEVRDIDEINVPEPKVRTINATVASLRLDSIAGAGFGMSRSKAAEFIKSEKVNLNWETIDSLTKQVKEGDVISIRGKGRVLVEKVGGLTRKGRTSVELKKFV